MISALLTRVLTHPAILRIKPPLRSAWVRVTERGTRNPPVPAQVGSMLFVCLGNICRSPFAAHLVQHLLRERGWNDVFVMSAGIRPSQARACPPEACEVAARYGLELDAHEPQPLTAELMERSDMVVVVEASQFRHLREQFPEHHNRIFLLGLFDAQAASAYERYNIADPFGQPLDMYVYCYRRIARALDALIEAARPCLLGGTAAPSATAASRS